MTSNPAKSRVQKMLCTQSLFIVDLSKIYFLKNAIKTCQPNNPDSNCDWRKVNKIWQKRCYLKCYLHFWKDSDFGNVTETILTSNKMFL